MLSKRISVDDMLAEHVQDGRAADADEAVLRVEVVEGAVLRVVEAREDEVADGLGVFGPAIGLAGFAQELWPSRPAPLGRRRRSRKGQGRGAAGLRPARTFARVVIRAGVGDALPAWAVVLAGVPGAETLAEAGAAGVAIATEPRIPARTGRVGLVEQYRIA
jgi:hypothetical protein